MTLRAVQRAQSSEVRRRACAPSCSKETLVFTLCDGVAYCVQSFVSKSGAGALGYCGTRSTRPRRKGREQPKQRSAEAIDAAPIGARSALSSTSERCATCPGPGACRVITPWPFELVSMWPRASCGVLWCRAFEWIGSDGKGLSKRCQPPCSATCRFGSLRAHHAREDGRLPWRLVLGLATRLCLDRSRPRTPSASPRFSTDQLGKLPFACTSSRCVASGLREEAQRPVSSARDVRPRPLFVPGFAFRCPDREKAKARGRRK